MTGPMVLADGTEIPLTGKSFDVDFCTVARWDNGQIVEENLFYNLATFIKPIRLSSAKAAPALTSTVRTAARSSAQNPSQPKENIPSSPAWRHTLGRVRSWGGCDPGRYALLGAVRR